MSSSSEQIMNIDSETREMILSYVSEALDSLDTYEPKVEELREEGNSDSVNSIFRVFHTLKGLSGFFGFMITNKVTHEAETLLDLIRKQVKPQDESTITVIYQTFDFLRDVMYRVSTEFTDSSVQDIADDMILILKDCIERVKNPDNQEKVLTEDDFMNLNFDELANETPEKINTIEESTEQTDTNNNEGFFDDSLLTDELLEQFITSASDILDLSDRNLLSLETANDQATLIQETFGAIHSLKGNAGFMGLSNVVELASDMETILDSLRNKELDPEPHIITILLSNLEIIRTYIEELDQKSKDLAKSNSSNKQNETHPVKESKQSIKTEEVINIPVQPENPIEIEAKIEKPKEIIKETPKTPTPIKSESSNNNNAQQHPAVVQKKDIRVETIKIDKLFDLVGELITIEAMVTNNPDLVGLELPNFSKSANILNKITRELQEISMSIRMMPLDGTFNKMKRLVRDVSLKMNKKINLEIFGSETEMDKNVIDEIADPLVHLLRNAIDHGVESPEVRLSKGKNETGLIKLGAKYEGNEILIIIEDDGAGIIRERILNKAEEKGLLKMDPELMTDKEVFQLLFEPGFSTAAQLTDISGRGVGMDVVKKNIDKLHGSIDVTSIPGKGSKFTLRIPLTLAIMESMIIRIGDCKYALPILSINESFRPQNSNITVTMDGLEVIKVRDEVLPIIRLHEQFDVIPDSKNIMDGILLILEAKNKRVCLFADEIVGQQQAVVKGLGDYIGKVPGVTGCMILGDGGIGLILDIDGLLEIAEDPKFADLLKHQVN